ncbi:growth/differentiation factor 10 isoform X2 [Thalassophryne amazonica]|uniref:growth/differentiation factor 10 isoform X2 n=1 Tax=Thalassophryne amazonica TaxID=390379 RepID=UPI001471FFCA|nr:growth/differentiation factor 10 isoform X2 [Thalassophryne amazonica]
MAAVSVLSSHLFLLLLNCFTGVAAIRIISGSESAQDGTFFHSSSDSFLHDLDGDVVSQHMYKLYEKYNRENRLKEGNTVRSFRAGQDLADHRLMYQLNLTTLQDSEVILSATFHFLLDRHPQKTWFCKRFKSPSCRFPTIHPSPSVSLLFYAASSVSGVTSGSLLGNVTFHLHRRGVWQMKDVTQVIKEARDKDNLLVSIELILGPQYQSKPEGRLSVGSLPYLLLYADDHALEEPNSVATSLQRYDPFLEGGEGSPSSEPTPLLHWPNSSPDLKGRIRREAKTRADTIQNNELPDVSSKPIEYRKEDLWESTWYLALKPKPKSEKKEKRTKSHVNAGAEESREQDREVPLAFNEGQKTSQSGDSSVNKSNNKHSQTVAISDKRKHEHRKDKDGKQHKGNINAQSPVFSFDEQTMRKARRRQWGYTQHRGCSRRNLRVDFADIGWSEWIIAPKSFDAYYCAGTCGFPMPKVTRPSNHATIQSIVRAVGIIPGIPEPCCVPEKMSPLAVLYQDESRNPVLKVYPKMSVQSCSCR